MTKSELDWLRRREASGAVISQRQRAMLEYADTHRQPRFGAYANLGNRDFGMFRTGRLTGIQAPGFMEHMAKTDFTGLHLMADRSGRFMGAASGDRMPFGGRLPGGSQQAFEGMARAFGKFVDPHEKYGGSDVPPPALDPDKPRNWKFQNDDRGGKTMKTDRKAKRRLLARADDGGGTTTDLYGMMSEKAQERYDILQHEHMAKKGRAMDHDVAMIRAMLATGDIDRDRAKQLAWGLRHERDRALAGRMAAKENELRGAGTAKADDYYVQAAVNDPVWDRGAMRRILRDDRGNLTNRQRLFLSARYRAPELALPESMSVAPDVVGRIRDKAPDVMDRVRRRVPAGAAEGFIPFYSSRRLLRDTRQMLHDAGQTLRKRRK